MTPQRYKVAEARRQRILDRLAEAGPQNPIEMAEYLGDPVNTVKNTLRSMVALNEVEPDGGIRGRMKYRHLVTITSDATSQYQSTRTKLDQGSRFTKAHELNRRKTSRTGVITHKAGDLKVPSQGGQGCVRTYGRRVNQDTM